MSGITAVFLKDDNMKVIRANILGYCMGVRRAVELAEQAVCSQSNDEPYSRVYTLGPLIHNSAALKSLEKRGIHCLHINEYERQDLKDATVIIRAHGIAPLLRYRLEQTGCRIIDATCPRVVSSQKRASDFSKKGYTVILAGDRNHGEVTGIAGYVEKYGGKCIIIENTEEAGSIHAEKAALIGQTTIGKDEYDAIAEVLRKKNACVTVCNTICPATVERQAALEELSRQVDAILVIGGRNSANTERLLRSAKKICKKTALIENADEIPETFLRGDIKTVGLTAGASTPDFIIDEVEEKLLQNG